MDVCRFEQVKNWIDGVRKGYGKIDCCLNAAGTFLFSSKTGLLKKLGFPGTFGKKIVGYEAGDWDSVINVNLKGVFNCLRAQLSTIEKGGSIVNISSVGGLHGLPGASAYIASKVRRQGHHAFCGTGGRSRWDSSQGYLSVSSSDPPF